MPSLSVLALAVLHRLHPVVAVALILSEASMESMPCMCLLGCDLCLQKKKMTCWFCCFELFSRFLLHICGWGLSCNAKATTLVCHLEWHRFSL